MTTRDTSGEALAEAMQGREGDIAFWMGMRRDLCPWANDGAEREVWLRKWEAAAAEARAVCLLNREHLIHQRTVRAALGGAFDCFSRVLRLAKLPPSLKLDVQNTRAAVERALQYATGDSTPGDSPSGSRPLGVTEKQSSGSG